MVFVTNVVFRRIFRLLEGQTRCKLRRISSSNFIGNNDAQDAVKSGAAYTPRRALMYVPASDERKLSKISSLRADCVVMDCEDAVAANRKDQARRNVLKILSDETTTAKFDFELGVRVNSLSSGLLEEDLKSILSSEAKFPPPAIMLPKVDSVDDLQTFHEMFTKYFTKNKNLHNTPVIKLVIWIESARALIDMPRILRAAKNLHTPSCPLSTEAVVFGSDDFCADIGATRSKEAWELQYARQKFLVVCKAFRLQAIDLVFIDYKDLDGLRLQAEQAQRMGFTGKQVIHPGQIAVVQKAFLPSEETVKWARELLDEFRKQETSGKGAMSFRGSMIDMPLVVQAKNIVELVEKTQKRS